MAHVLDSQTCVEASPEWRENGRDLRWIALAGPASFLLGFELVLWLPYYRTAIPLAVVYLLIAPIVYRVLVHPIVDAVLWGERGGSWKTWVAAVVLAITSATFYLHGSVYCSYCHNSNSNVKGNCVKRQKHGWCDEDYYHEHHNKDTCSWCGRSGKHTRLAGFLD